MRALTLLLVLFALPPAAGAAGLDLLAGAQWSANTDRPTSTMVLAPEAAGLAVDVTANGGQEDYPKLRRAWDAGQDWQAYGRLRTRLRVTCDDPAVREKEIAFVLYDEKTILPDHPGKPMKQQSLRRTVPVGQWTDVNEWLIGIQRSAIRQLDLYLYEIPSSSPHKYRWEIARLELQRTDKDVVALDGEVYEAGALKGAQSRPAGRLRTADGLELALGEAGDAAVSLNGVALGAPSATCPAGLMLRDAATQDPPVMAGGTLKQSGKELRQSARLNGLGLALEATYRSRGDCLEIQGSVADLKGEDRAVSVTFAVPVAEAPWVWWDSVTASRAKPDERGELACLETGRAYGMGGAHSKYPLGAVTWPGRAGLTLAVRMDEPVVHRIAYHPGLRLFYITLDFGLVPDAGPHPRPLSRSGRGETAAEQLPSPVAGEGPGVRALSTAPFRILLYRHDPAWGFRSALQRYYALFPSFFRRTDRRDGGWYVWGDVQDTAGAREAGFRFHWGPQDPKAVRFDNKNGFIALNYIEPEFYQLTMGDFDRAPTPAEAITRLRKLAEGDESEMARFEKLSYAKGGGGHMPGVGMKVYLKKHSLREYLQALARATLASVGHDRDGNPYCYVGKYPWMGESQWGAIFPCNLIGSVPQGKGWFNSRIVLENAFRGWKDAGARIDGIGLDSLGGYGQDSRVDYRRENFRYAQFPLSFSAQERRPVQVMAFATLQWVRELAREMHGQGKVLMANCAWGNIPAWLTFAAPSLDVFGAEASRFSDPDYIRAIAYRKACTDLPYKPRPEWEVPWHLLHAIAPGHGHDVKAMAAVAGPLRELAAAGWEPVTGARVIPETVRVERFGKALLVLHNPGEAVVQAEVALDTGTLGRCAAALDGRPVETRAGRLLVPLAGRQTVVLRLSGK